MTEAPTRGTLEDLASVVLLKGEGAFNLEVTNHGAVAPWGRWEQYITQSGVYEEATAMILAQTALEKTARERVELTRGITPHAARWLPWRDYRPGDTILAPGSGRVMEPLRIRMITLRRDQNGITSGSLTLNDRFLEREIRQARRSAGILGGSIGDGGTGVRPAPESPKPQVPVAPLGLVVNPVAYIDSAGYPQGLATVSWGVVDHDVDGLAVDVDTYEVYMRRNLAGEVWFQVEVTVVGTETVNVSPLNIGWEYAFKVRATSRESKGVFSEPVAVVIPDDAVAPPTPTPPAVTTRLGQIHVAWDGQGVDPGPVPMPPDFDRVKVWMQDPLDPGAAEVDYLTAAGSVVIPNQDYGADREIWLTAVDRSGNESPHSAHVIVATAPIVNTDLIGQIIDGAEHVIDGSIPGEAKIVAGSITGGQIKALAIDTGHLAANAVEADKIAAGAVQAGHIQANAISADKIQAGAIIANKLAADAIDGKTITGAHIRTAATGPRLELAPPGAAYPEMRLYPASGTNYTTLRTRSDVYAGEATFTLNSGVNQAGTASAELELSSGSVRMQIRNDDGTGNNGGYADWGVSAAEFGYRRDGGSQNYFRFGQNICRHFGAWDDYGSLPSNAGLLWGSISVGGSNKGYQVVYPSTMDSNMGPIIGFRPGASTDANVSWAITTSSSDRYTVSWTVGQSVAIYQCSFRH